MAKLTAVMAQMPSIAPLGHAKRAFAGAASFVAPANANVPSNVVQTRVAYGDLNLNSVEGQKQLAARIQHAATQVCGTDDAADRFEYASCRAKAVKSAYEDAHKAGVAL